MIKIRKENRGKRKARSQKPEYGARENNGPDSPVKPGNDGRCLDSPPEFIPDQIRDRNDGRGLELRVKRGHKALTIFRQD